MRCIPNHFLHLVEKRTQFYLFVLLQNKDDYYSKQICVTKSLYFDRHVATLTGVLMTPTL